MRIFFLVTGSILYYLNNGLPFQSGTEYEYTQTTSITNPVTETTIHDPWVVNNDSHEFEEESEEETWEDVAVSEEQDFVESEDLEYEGGSAFLENEEVLDEEQEVMAPSEESEETLEGRHVSDENPITWAKNIGYNSPSGTETYINADGDEVQSPTRSISRTNSPTAICRDGTYSYSRNRRGTCSHHGGVREWLK